MSSPTIGVQSLRRAFAVLRALGNGPLGVSDVAVASHIPKSTAARLLAALAAEGAVEQVPGERRYRLGPDLLAIASGLSETWDIVSIARPTIAGLAAELGEAAGVSIRDGWTVQYVDQIEPPNPNEVTVRDWTGTRIPLHAVSSGQVFLAQLPAPMLARYLAEPLEAFTPRTLTDAGALLERLRDVRRDGHAWVQDEYAVGISSVAAPIADARAEIVAAVHVHGPSYRFPPPGEERRIAAAVRTAAARIGARLRAGGKRGVSGVTGAAGEAGAAAGSREAGERGWVAVVAALVLVGLAFRTQALIIGPLVGQVQAELGMSHAVAGLLGTIPVLCMGLLAPLGPVLAASIGPRLGVAICVGLVGIFGVARAFLPDTLTVLSATIGVGVGMAVVGPILSMVVRSRLPNHPAAGTGAYVVGFVVGGTITAAVAVPLADAFGGWRPAFAIVAAAAFVSLAAWLVLAPKDAGHERVAPSRPKLPWRRPAAWLLGAIFGSQSILFYGCITWLGSVYVERGWSAGQAGGLIALLTGIGLVSTLAVPAFADRVGTRRTQLTLAALLSVAGAIIVALTPTEAPGSAVTLLATALLGLGIGAYFPLALTLPVDVASDGPDAASIAAFMLLIGYTLAALSPVVLGVVRDATGNFHAVVWILVAISVAMIPLALALNPARLRSAGAS